MGSPKIAVIMPVWNGEKHLAAAIDSILSQTWTDFEFLILDDGSTDRSTEILADYQTRDSRIRIIRLGHEGIVAALNRGVAEARAGWIARMDCDDIALPTRLEVQWNALKDHPGAVLCHTNIERFGDEALIGGERHFPMSMALVKARLCFSCPLVHPTVMFSKAAFDAAGGYRLEERHAEDFALWGRLVAQGDFVGIPARLLRFRVHGASISKRESGTQQRLTREIAARHSEWFLGAEPGDAERLWNAFNWETSRSGIREWIWVASRFLHRIRPTSIELWAWALSQAVQRIRKSG